MNNKYQEALYSILKGNPKVNLTTSDIHKDIRLLHELVNKETPMKVNKQANKEKVYLNDVSYVYEDVVLGECPNCETYLHEVNEYGDTINYCPICGQKLDWSEEE